MGRLTDQLDMTLTVLTWLKNSIPVQSLDVEAFLFFVVFFFILRVVTTFERCQIPGKPPCIYKNCSVFENWQQTFSVESIHLKVTRYI